MYCSNNKDRTSADIVLDLRLQEFVPQAPRKHESFEVAEVATVPRYTPSSHAAAEISIYVILTFRYVVLL